MDRRAFVIGIGVTLAAPLAAEAQPARKISRVGYLSPSSLSDPRTQRFVDAFRQGLRDLGWSDGDNIGIEYRWADERTERLAGLASELVRLRMDVIVAATTPAIVAAKQATGTIPIVMANAAGPVETGIVASIAQPGGNITGLSMMAPGLVGKQMQLLTELVPKTNRLAVLGNPTNAINAPQLRQAQDAARALDARLQSVEARAPGDLEGAFAAMIRERAGALIVLTDTMLARNRAPIAALAMKNRLPAVYGATEYVEAGGLMAYGPNQTDLYRRAATYVDKILKGAKPADLPVEQPTKFELSINLKTAKALGLTIPPSLLLRADQVLE